jgi:hypothetical protein
MDVRTTTPGLATWTEFQVSLRALSRLVVDHSAPSPDAAFGRDRRCCPGDWKQHCLSAFDNGEMRLWEAPIKVSASPGLLMPDRASALRSE